MQTTQVRLNRTIHYIVNDVICLRCGYRCSACDYVTLPAVGDHKPDIPKSKVDNTIQPKPVELFHDGKWTLYGDMKEVIRLVQMETGIPVLPVNENKHNMKAFGRFAHKAIYPKIKLYAIGFEWRMKK